MLVLDNMAPKESLILTNKLRTFTFIDLGSNGFDRKKMQNLFSQLFFVLSLTNLLSTTVTVIRKSFFLPFF